MEQSDLSFSISTKAYLKRELHWTDFHIVIQPELHCHTLGGREAKIFSFLLRIRYFYNYGYWCFLGILKVSLKEHYPTLFQFFSLEHVSLSSCCVDIKRCASTRISASACMFSYFRLPPVKKFFKYVAHVCRVMVVIIYFFLALLKLLSNF